MGFSLLLKRSGMTEQEYAEYFWIPASLIHSWASQPSFCPDYLLELMAYKLAHEGIIPQTDAHCMITYTPPEIETARFPVDEMPLDMK